MSWFDSACSTRQEYRTFRRCADFPVVGALQSAFRLQPRRGRLSFDMQREIAVRLGYTSHPGMQDVERFMKHYFRSAKDVGDLTCDPVRQAGDEQPSRRRC